MYVSVVSRRAIWRTLESTRRIGGWCCLGPRRATAAIRRQHLGPIGRQAFNCSSDNGHARTAYSMAHARMPACPMPHATCGEGRRENERERNRTKERERHTHTHTHTQRERERETHTHTERERKRARAGSVAPCAQPLDSYLVPGP